MFDVIQSLLNTVVYPNKEIKFPKFEKEEISLGTIKALRNNNDSNFLNGLVANNTEIQFTSSSASIYFLIEITKNTYDYSISGYPEFELIVRLLKRTLQRLKDESCSHSVNIIFFTRIFFTEREEPIVKKYLTNKKNENYYYKVGLMDNRESDFFFDIYTNILQINCKKFEELDIYFLNKAFIDFSAALNVNNLSQFIQNINNLEKDIELNNSMGLNKERSNSTTINNTVSSYKKINNIINTKVFDEIKTFKMCSPANTNILEAINIAISEIRREKVDLNKLGDMIIVISSSDSFPYYNSDLAKFTKENLYERGIPCSCIRFSNKEILNQNSPDFEFNKRKIDKLLKEEVPNESTLFKKAVLR